MARVFLTSRTHLPTPTEIVRSRGASEPPSAAPGTGNSQASTRAPVLAPRHGGGGRHLGARTEHPHVVANGERRIGSSRRTAARELLDAIGKLRLAYLDLEHAMHRAGHPPLPLRTLELERTAPEPAGSRKRLSAPVVGALSKALAADLAAVDSLITETEALQRQARTPQSR